MQETPVTQYIFSRATPLYHLQQMTLNRFAVFGSLVYRNRGDELMICKFLTKSQNESLTPYVRLVAEL